MNKDEVSLLIRQILYGDTQEYIQLLKDHENNGIKWGLFFFFIFVVDNIFLLYLIWNK